MAARLENQLERKSAERSVHQSEVLWAHSMAAPSAESAYLWACQTADQLASQMAVHLVCWTVDL